MNFYYYPFDKNRCHFKLIAEYTIEEIMYEWKEKFIHAKNHAHELPGWTISEPMKTQSKIPGPSNTCKNIIENAF